MIRSLKSRIPEPLYQTYKSEFHKETHINRAIRTCRGTTYIEIGVRAGDCFRRIKATRKIGIDPSPLPSNYSLAPGESFIQVTSDDFFVNYVEDCLDGHRIDVALVDGMHEFTQALRDILNLERFMSGKGVIFIHDCNPPNEGYTEKNPRYWNGDVWKVAYYLRVQRPDLHFFTLDCDWGVGVLTGFHPSSDLSYPSADILATYKQLGYDVLNRQRRKILHLCPYWYSYFFFNFVYPLRTEQS